MSVAPDIASTADELVLEPPKAAPSVGPDRVASTIKIDDADLRPGNFDTIAKVEVFVERAKAAA